MAHLNKPMDKDDIENYLKEVGKELRKLKADGEVVICGGAVMLLYYNARESTRDIDGLFAPVTELNEVIRKVANKYKLEYDWFNSDFARTESMIPGFRESCVFFKRYYNLDVYVAPLDLMIAMKLVSFRIGEKQDLPDLKHLIEVHKKEIGGFTKEDGYKYLKKYYGDKDILSELAKVFLESF